MFTFVAVMHLFRLVFLWPVHFGEATIPLSFSIPALLFAVFLAYQGWYLSQAKEVIGETDQQKNFDKLMEIFNTGQPVTNDVVQMLLGVSDSTATRYLEHLEKEGRIIQIGREGRGVTYRRK